MSRVDALRLRPGATWAEALPMLLEFARGVGNVLNGGTSLRDQVRTVRDVVIDTAAMPVVITLPASVSPLGVVLVRAVSQSAGDGRVISGGPIEWDAVPQGVRIHGVDALDSSTRYDCVIAVVE